MTSAGVLRPSGLADSSVPSISVAMISSHRKAGRSGSARSCAKGFDLQTPTALVNVKTAIPAITCTCILYETHTQRAHSDDPRRGDCAGRRLGSLAWVEARHTRDDDLQ